MWILCASPIWNPVLGALLIRSRLWAAAEMVLSETTARVDNMHSSKMSVDIHSADNPNIEVGRRADLVLLDLDAVGFVPLNDLVRHSPWTLLLPMSPTAHAADGPDSSRTCWCRDGREVRKVQPH